MQKRCGEADTGACYTAAFALPVLFYAMDAPVDYLARTRAQYEALGYPPYRWVRNDDPPPFTPLGKPLTACRVALIASGGIYRLGQIAFHFQDDTSFRVVPSNTRAADLRVTHFAYDLTAARSDHNAVFPSDTLANLARLNRIGELSKHAYTFMGGIYSSRRVREHLAPALADRVQRDEVDVAVLVPV